VENLKGTPRIPFDAGQYAEESPGKKRKKGESQGRRRIRILLITNFILVRAKVQPGLLVSPSRQKNNVEKKKGRRGKYATRPQAQTEAKKGPRERKKLF